LEIAPPLDTLVAAGEASRRVLDVGAAVVREEEVDVETDDVVGLPVEVAVKERVDDGDEKI